VHVKAAIENTKYYLNKNGKMQTGWQKIGEVEEHHILEI